MQNNQEWTNSVNSFSAKRRSGQAALDLLEAVTFMTIVMQPWLHLSLDGPQVPDIVT